LLIPIHDTTVTVSFQTAYDITFGYAIGSPINLYMPQIIGSVFATEQDCPAVLSK
jgi:hypothetical protein